MAPQLRMKLDKILVKLFSDQWRDMRVPGNNISTWIGKLGSDIERVRGWSHEMENGEKAFVRELLRARKHIEESAEAAARPSRELEDYSTSGSKGPSTTNLQTPDKSRPNRSEKQGWLNLRTITGKPSRTVWIRRWFFVKNGIFSWLVQGSRSGGVEESERIGVLLCSIRPATTEERRFCFEIKTTNHSFVVQADAQNELQDWIGAFETAKQKALQDPTSTDSLGLDDPQAQDAAFAIAAPSALEFAASAADSGMQQFGDDNGLERNLTIPASAGEPNSALASRSSFDVSVSRRSTNNERDGESSRDPASRMKVKLDLHRKSPSSPPPPSPGISGGGIASLIAASHNVMPVGPGILPQTPAWEGAANHVSSANSTRNLPANSLAPNTLVNPPAPTNLSATAVIVNGEKGIGIGRIDATGGMPSGIMANVWGTSNWGYLNRLERGELKAPQDERPNSANPPTAMVPPATASTTSQLHRKSVSLGPEKDTSAALKPNEANQQYPNYYPLQLKTQDAQFRLLFPNVRRQETLVLVFRATWNLNEQQEFPGRVYVTTRNIYFYSNHIGLVLTSGISIASISEITAAPGKECDFLFLHLKDTDSTNGFTRITVKTFLEPLKLLQRRLNFLVGLNSSPEAPSLEFVMKSLIGLEQDDSKSSPSLESWEDVSMGTSQDDSTKVKRNTSQRYHRDLKTSVHVDPGLYRAAEKLEEGKDTKFKLPRQPVVYVPSGMNGAVVDKILDVSPKALFHVMFGDRSAVWQLLYHERRAQRKQLNPTFFLAQLLMSPQT